MNTTTSAAAKNKQAGYNRLLLLVAGLGGLLYGVDVGIIAGALPYLEATSGLSGNQLSVIVAAVLLCGFTGPNGVLKASVGNVRTILGSQCGERGSF